MEMEIIKQAAMELLLTIALGVLTLAGSYAAYYIKLATAKVKAQTAQIQDTTARNVFENALADVADLAQLAVAAMEQTTAKSLREAVKQGKADRAELVALGKQVFDEVKATVAPEAQRVITATVGSFDEYLRKVIEAEVLRIKQAEPFLTLPEGIVADGVAVNTA